MHGGPEGVRSTERSEARNAPTRSEAEGHALRKINPAIPDSGNPAKGNPDEENFAKKITIRPNTSTLLVF